MSSANIPQRLHLSPPELLEQGGEVAVKKAEWDRKMSTLDQQEIELHNTQVRMIREQTLQVIRDLGVVQDEVSALRLAYDGCRASLTANFEAHREAAESSARGLELRVVGLERGQLGHKELEALEARAARAVEAAMGELREEAMRRDARIQADIDRRVEHFRALAEQEREVMQGKLQDLMSLHAEAFAKVQVLEAHQGGFGERIERLEREASGQASKRWATLEREVAELREELVEERRVGGSRSMRLASLEAKGTAALELATQQQLALDRLAELERASVEAAEQQRAEAERAARKLEQHTLKLVDLQTQILVQAGLAERVDQLEGYWGETGERQRDELTAVGTKLEQILGRLGACERQGAIQELQRGAAAEAAERAKLAECVRRLEDSQADAAARHATDLESLRAPFGRLEALSQKCARDLESVKSSQALGAGLADRVAGLEQAVADIGETQAHEVIALQAKLDRLGSRLAPCEALVQPVSELRRASAAAVSEIGHFAAAQDSLRVRVDEFEISLQAAAERHGSAIESAQGKLEQLHGRLSHCERIGSAVTDLQSSRTVLSSDRAALDGQHLALRERVDTLAQVLGDSVDRHSRDIEGLKALQTRHTEDLRGAARSASVEARLASLERQFAEDVDARHQELAPLRAALEEAAGRIAGCEQRAVGGVAELRRAQAAQVAEGAALAAAQASILHRLDEMEQALAEAGERQAHAFEVADAKVEHLQRASEALAEVLVGVTGSLPDTEEHRTLANELRSCHTSPKGSGISQGGEVAAVAAASLRQELAGLRARLDALGQATAGHVSELEALKTQQRRQAEELLSIDSRWERRLLDVAAGEERVSSIEALVTDMSATLTREVQRMMAAHEDFVRQPSVNGSPGTDEMVAALRSRVAGLEAMVREDGSCFRASIEEQRIALAKVVADIHACTAQDLKLTEHVANLESSIHDSAEEQSCELAWLRSAVTELQLVMEEGGRPLPPLPAVGAGGAAVDAAGSGRVLADVSMTSVGTGAGTAVASAASTTIMPTSSIASLASGGIVSAASYASAALRRASPEPSQRTTIRGVSQEAAQMTTIRGGSVKVASYALTAPRALPPSSPPAPSGPGFVSTSLPMSVQRSASVAATTVVMPPPAVVQRVYSMPRVATVVPAAMPTAMSVSVPHVGARPALSLFDQIDTDHDGVLSREEFARAMFGNRAAAAAAP